MNEYKKLLDRYHLKYSDLKKITGIPERTIENWCRGYRTPPKYMLYLLKVAIIEYIKAGVSAEGGMYLWHGYTQ